LTDFVAFAEATLLCSLRLGPSLAGAGPFGLIRIPTTVRVFLALGIAGAMMGANPDQVANFAVQDGNFLLAAPSELFIGVLIALALHLAFSAVQFAGRIVDLQAGFGMALLADPNLRGQMPLVGSLMAYACAIVFFSTSGPADLLVILARSLEALPLGAAFEPPRPEAILSLWSAVTLLALGLSGLLLLVLFLIDISIGLMSRTLPQMNVLMLGFQVKTLAVLILLPLTIPTASALYLRIIRLTFETTATWFGG
jgi:flagellar biosynthetic protein FliR